MGKPRFYVCHYGEGLDPFVATDLEAIKDQLFDMYGGKPKGAHFKEGGFLEVDWWADFEGDFTVGCYPVSAVHGEERSTKSRAA